MTYFNVQELKQRTEKIFNEKNENKKELCHFVLNVLFKHFN